MNKPVNLEIAKLLFDKKYSKPTEANWWILTKDHSDNYMNGLPVDESKIFFAKDSHELESKIHIDENTEHNVFHYLVAPTIAEVVMWLYENHGIWICVDKAEDFNWWKFGIRKLNDIGYERIGFGSDFNTPSEAYEAAITHTLKNLI